MTLNEKRKLNYDRLRAAGFSSNDATKYKDYGAKKIDYLIKVKQKHKKEIEDVKAMIKDVKL